MTPRAARRSATLIVMLKEPVAGRIKTRLAREAGTASATRFTRHNIALTLRRLSRDPRWTIVLSIAPDSAIASRMFPPAVLRQSQGHGDLGARMARAAQTCQHAPVIIIGADIPAIRASDIAAALRALRAADAVFGPSDDGGYWLIGFNDARQAARAFSKVRWSSAHAMSDTARNLQHLRVARTLTKSDIDEARDLQAHAHAVGRLIV